MTKKISITRLLSVTFFILIIFTLVKCTNSPQTELVDLSSKGTPKISELGLNSDRIGLYEKFEITFNVDGKWDNPFDPDQIKVDAHFTSPDGKIMTVPGFFYQEYRQNNQNSPVKTGEPVQNVQINLAKVGEPVWKVRFTPAMTGEYKYEVVVINNGKELKSPSHTFTCVPYNASHGFLRVSKTNPLYFEYDDGTPFFGVAQDRNQGDDRGCYRRFAEAGGNFNRLFLTGGKFNIEETTRPPERADRGFGKMNLEAAWNVDKVLELGENLGIYHMLTLTNQTAFNGGWQNHNYNKANGGILDSKNEFWTSEEAMKYFERRLRYEIARWGYSTSVFSWCFWNEYTAMGINPDNIDDAVNWHRRMAKYVASLDNFDHIIHTNDGSLNGWDQMHGLPEIDVVSTNAYAVKNIAPIAENWTKKFTDQFRKPYLLTEYGPGHEIGITYGEMDPERRMVHDGLWSTLMSGSAATGMAWEGSWLDHETFYTYLKAVTQFVDGIPFSKRQWEPVSITSFRYKDRDVPQKKYSDALIEGWPGNFRIPSGAAVNQESFQIDRNGIVDPQELLSAVLVSPDAKNTTWLSAPYGLTQSVTFNMEYPVDGKFVTYITELRDTTSTPQMTISVDGREALQKDLLPLKVENYKPRRYNIYYSIDVEKGPHTIKVANTGGGSFVTAYELKDYVLRGGPDVEVTGLQTDDYILLWLKNPKFTWLHELANIQLITQPEGILQLKNISNGAWIVDWFNTIDAKLLKSELVNTQNQTINLNTPTIEKSIAIRLRKI